MFRCLKNKHTVLVFLRVTGHAPKRMCSVVSILLQSHQWLLDNPFVSFNKGESIIVASEQRDITKLENTIVYLTELMKGCLKSTFLEKNYKKYKYCIENDILNIEFIE